MSLILGSDCWNLFVWPDIFDEKSGYILAIAVTSSISMFLWRPSPSLFDYRSVDRRPNMGITHSWELFEMKVSVIQSESTSEFSTALHFTLVCPYKSLSMCSFQNSYLSRTWFLVMQVPLPATDSGPTGLHVKAVHRGPAVDPWVPHVHAKTSESDVKYLRKTAGLIKTVLHWFWHDSWCIFWIFLRTCSLPTRIIFINQTSYASNTSTFTTFAMPTRPPRYFFLPTVFWGIQSHIWGP